MAPLRHDPSNPKCRYTDDWSADESTDFCSCPPADLPVAAPANDSGGELQRERVEATNVAAPVAAPDPAETIRRLIDEAVALQAADPEPENTERRFTELRDDLVVAALYELPALLAERQQDKERIERLETALRGTNALAAAILSHRGHASIEMCLEEVLANATAIQTFAAAALAVEEDADGD